MNQEKMRYFVLILYLFPFLAFPQSDEFTQAYNNWSSYQGEGDFENALPWAHKTVELAEEIYGSDNEYYGSYTSGLALIYRMLGDYESSVQWYLVAMDAYKQSLGKDHEYFASVLFSLAVIYQFQGDIKLAEQTYTESRSIYESVLGKEHPYYIMNTYSLGYLYLNESKYLKAMPYLVEWERLANEFLEPSYDMAISLNNVGNVYESTGDYRTALQYYAQSLHVFETIGMEEDLEYLKSVSNLGGVLLVMGDYFQAELILLEALELAEQNEDFIEIYLIIMDNLGMLYYELGQYDKAEKRHMITLEERKKLYGEDDSGMADSYNYLAMLYEETGRYEDAHDLYALSLILREEELGTEDPDYAVSLNNLASYYTNRGYYEDAIPLFMEASEILKNDISQKSVYSKTLNALGVISHRLGDCRQAVSYYKKSLAIDEEIVGKDHIECAADLSNMAHAYECLGDLDSAELLYEQSNKIYTDQIYNQFPFLNEKDKENFYNQVSYNFESFNSFALKRIASNPLIIRNVYNLHVLHKGLLLDESKKLRKHILNSNDTASINLYNSWTSQKELLATLYAAQDQSEELSDLEKKVDKLERELLVQSTGFNELQQKQRITWRDVQNKLQPGEVAIEVVRSQIYENEWLDSVAYFALIVTPPPKERPGLIVFLDGNNLEGKYYTNYRNALRFRIPDTVSYNNYWKPFDDVLSNYGEINKIYFSADGVYNKINVAGLLNAKTGNYVIDEYDIHLMSNTKDLLYIEEMDSPMLTATLFGFPDFENKDISETEMDVSNVLAYQPLPVDNSRYFSRDAVSELPGTKVEIESIYKMLQQSHLETSIHTRREASEANIKAMDPPDIVHIATHGFFLKDGDITRNGQRGLMVEDNLRKNPLLRSGLLLAGANNTLQAMQTGELLQPGHEDGILTAYEVSNLNLMNTKLVVLSACETGLGEIKNGQGVYGLQRAFSVAGAQTLIMSLWKVSDDATQKLMTHFYGHLVENKPIRKSFRLAQLELREEYNHPYFWAAFVIVGN